MPSNHDLEDFYIAQRVSETLPKLIPQLPEPGNRIVDVADRLRLLTITLKEDIARMEQQRKGSHSEQLFKDLVKATLHRQLYLWQIFPINDLPTEIMAHIFDLAIMSTSMLTSPGQLTRTRKSLTSVCSRWRDIVIATPALWSTIEFMDRQPFQYSRTCLERAKSASLVMFIDQRDDKWDRREDVHRFGPDDMDGLMKIIAPHVNHTRELYLFLDTWPTMLVALGQLRNISEPPLLRRFEAHRSGSMYVSLAPGLIPSDLTAPITLFGGKAQALRDVCFNGVHVNWTLTPLRNLTVLDMRQIAMELAPPLEEFRAMLLGSPSLQVVALVGAGPKRYRDGQSPGSSLELAHVHTLSLANFSVGYAEFILGLFTAPRVRRLSLAALNGEDCASLLRRMTHAFPQVTVLTIGDLQIQDTPDNQTVLSSWLYSMPKLRYLKAFKVPDRFFDPLLTRTAITSHDGLQSHPTARRDPSHPNLKTLELHGIPVMTVWKLLEARAKLGVEIQKLWTPVPAAGGLPMEVKAKVAAFVALDTLRGGSQPGLDPSYLVD